MLLSAVYSQHAFQCCVLPSRGLGNEVTIYLSISWMQ